MAYNPFGIGGAWGQFPNSTPTLQQCGACGGQGVVPPQAHQVPPRPGYGGNVQPPWVGADQQCGAYPQPTAYQAPVFTNILGQPMPAAAAAAPQAATGAERGWNVGDAFGGFPGGQSGAAPQPNVGQAQPNGGAVPNGGPQANGGNLGANDAGAQQGGQAAQGAAMPPCGAGAQEATGAPYMRRGDGMQEDVRNLVQFMV